MKPPEIILALTLTIGAVALIAGCREQANQKPTPPPGLVSRNAVVPSSAVGVQLATTNYLTIENNRILTPAEVQSNAVQEADAQLMERTFRKMLRETHAGEVEQKGNQ